MVTEHKPCPAENGHTDSETAFGIWLATSSPTRHHATCLCGVSGPWRLTTHDAWDAWDDMPQQDDGTKCEDHRTYRVGDRVALARIRTIDKDHSPGWVGYQKLLVKGAKGIITKIHASKGGIRYAIKFDGDNHEFSFRDDELEPDVMPRESNLEVVAGLVERWKQEGEFAQNEEILYLKARLRRAERALTKIGERVDQYQEWTGHQEASDD